MWKAKTGEQVDGVLALDPFALRALVKVSGPVKVERQDDRRGQRGAARSCCSSTSTTRPISPIPNRTCRSNDQRRERNGEIARAIVDQLDKAGWNIADLVDDLRTAARGRHVLFWSADPAQQRGWKAAGVSGVLPSDAFMVSLENRAGNKLDQFVRTAVVLKRRAVPAGTEVTATIIAEQRSADRRA